MKRITQAGLAGAIALVLLVPANGQATRGGLDRAGGHHCWTKCAKQGKYRGQYHCHKKTKRCKKAKRRHRRHGH